MNGLRKKCKKPPFLGILVQNGQFWTAFGPNGQNGNFFKKALGTFFSRIQALTNCKVSEKSNERFSSNRVTHACTDGRTDEWTWILRSPTTSSRDQKCTEKRLFNKEDTPSTYLWGFLGSKMPILADLTPISMNIWLLEASITLSRLKIIRDSIMGIVSLI